MKIQKKKIFFFLGGGCERRRSKAFVKIQKKINFLGGWGVGVGLRGGGQGGCEWRSEAFVKIKKKKWGGGGDRVGGGGGGGGGVRVDGNGELKLL